MESRSAIVSPSSANDTTPISHDMAHEQAAAPNSNLPHDMQGEALLSPFIFDDLNAFDTLLDQLQLNHWMTPGAMEWDQWEFCIGG